MAAIETAWSLQDAGFDVLAFQRAGTRPAVRRVRGIRVYQVPPPEQDASATVAAIRSLYADLTPAALLPLDDSALWVCRQLDADPAILVAGGTGPAIDSALDKSIQLEVAAKAGLPVPATLVTDDLRDLSQVDFPVMVKPALALYAVDGALRRPTGIVCADQLELARAAEKPWPGRLLVQPLIRGTGVGLFGHAGPGGVTAWSAHRRVRMVNPQGSASAACRSEPVSAWLAEACERFLHAIGWRGMFMLEFLVDANGKPWFMELNGRAWGSMALARRRGFEYPAWTVQAALDKEFTPPEPAAPPEIRCRNLGLELVHLAFVARGPQSSAEMEWPKLGTSVKEVLTFKRNDRLYNWNRAQPAVFLADLTETLRTYGRKMTSRRR